LRSSDWDDLQEAIEHLLRKAIKLNEPVKATRSRVNERGYLNLV
jgi:hypothetical protein